MNLMIFYFISISSAQDKLFQLILNMISSCIKEISLDPSKAENIQEGNKCAAGKPRS